jgi:hypothetical protein
VFDAKHELGVEYLLTRLKLKKGDMVNCAQLYDSDFVPMDAEGATDFLQGTF